MVICKPPQALPSDGGHILEATEPVRESPPPPASSVSSEMLVMSPSPRLISLRMSYASLGPLAFDLYSGNSRRASVMFGVRFLSLNDFPKPLVLCLVQVSSVPGRWGLRTRSVERLENVAPRKSVEENEDTR